MYKLAFKRNTKKVINVFILNDKNTHHPEGECTCGSIYIGETISNVEVWWGKHENIKTDFKPKRHLKANKEHASRWKVLLPAQSNFNQKRRSFHDSNYIT